MAYRVGKISITRKICCTRALRLTADTTRAARSPAAFSSLYMHHTRQGSLPLQAPGSRLSLSRGPGSDFIVRFHDAINLDGREALDGLGLGLFEHALAELPSLVEGA
jgi:hypothetical protein